MYLTPVGRCFLFVLAIAYRCGRVGPVGGLPEALKQQQPAAGQLGW